MSSSNMEWRIFGNYDFNQVQVGGREKEAIDPKGTRPAILEEAWRREVEWE